MRSLTKPLEPTKTRVTLLAACSVNPRGGPPTKRGKWRHHVPWSVGMWKIAAMVTTIAFVASFIVTEVLRSIIHARRLRHTAPSGTQDIAMWGTLLSCALLLVAIACWAIWYITK